MPTQEQARKMVNENVLVSVTELIYNLYADDNYEDRLYSMMVVDVYDRPAADEGYEVERRVDGFYIVNPLEENACTDGPYTSEYEAWKSACESNSIEPYQDEIHEHYVVTDWLARKLIALGEVVEYDFLGLTIWGRVAYGQAVYLDAVMVQITAETPQYMKE